MGKEKGGFLTPKAIANRIKSKGLQKLRWYCQMCQKQCRDENGFKCHTMSESHQRQLLIAGLYLCLNIILFQIILSCFIYFNAFLA